MVDKLIEIWEKLTFTKVLLGIFAGISGISLYTIWEQRNAVFITLTGSMLAMTSMAVGVCLLFVAGACWLFVAALDRKNEMVNKAMGERITDLQKQVDMQRKDLDTVREEGDRMRRDFAQQLQAERDECSARLKEIRDAFTTLKEGKK